MSKRHMTRVAGTALAMLCLSALPALAETRFAVQDTTGTIDKMVVTDTGYIGVGNNAPVAAVHVKGTDANNTNIISHYVNTSAGGGGNVNLLHNNLPSTANPNGVPQAGDRLGNIMFGSYLSSTLRVAGGGISGYAEGTWTSTSTPTYFVFGTAPVGSTTRAERMRITSAGNIGIGTGSPKQKLEVNGGLRLATSTTKPACDVTQGRGTLWYTQAAAGIADTIEVCAKDAAGNYAWKPLF